MNSIPDIYTEIINSKYIERDIFLMSYWDRVKHVHNSNNIDNEKFADLFMIACLAKDNANVIPKGDIYNKTHKSTREYISNYFNTHLS